jgi:hypothetical protein
MAAVSPKRLTFAHITVTSFGGTSAASILWSPRWGSGGQRLQGYGPNVQEFCGSPNAFFNCGSPRTSQSRLIVSR